MSSNHPLQYINARNPLIRQTSDSDLLHPGGHIYNMKTSHDGRILATASTGGSVRLWNTNNSQLIYELRIPPSLTTVQINPINESEDTEPITKHVIDEFYFVEFSPDDKIVVVGGKRKDRHEWDPLDDDNKILACPLVLFDLNAIVEDKDEDGVKDYHVPTKAVSILSGHTEEVLCIQSIKYNDEFYYVTGSYDGSIIKWKMKEDYKTLDGNFTQILDGKTNVVLSIEQIPNTKYLITGADSYIKVYDFEKETLIYEFETEYSEYCDCVRLLQPVGDNSYQILTRGIEVLHKETNLPSQPNMVHLRELTFSEHSSPVKSSKTKKQNQWNIKTISTFKHPEYLSNSWLTKINTSFNKRYLFAPTSNGKVFIWNIQTNKLAAVLHDHADEEVRDVTIHPTKNLLLTCGDDAKAKIYKSEPKEGRDKVPQAVVEEPVVRRSNSTSGPKLVGRKQTEEEREMAMNKMDVDETEQSLEEEEEEQSLEDNDSDYGQEIKTKK
ncbi:hypothetical protein AKO1_006131 [Acrasis kona]|uniref:WD40 repeat-like protein n=1 Tax=Acrasis kona TaxID=1008807 RepID=A0AAW2YJC7_9EUKA